jgi:hypothetical protein
MSKFEFFFAFYGLILGLAVAELLQGVGSVVRDRQIHRIGAQTALLVAFVLFLCVATWLDAWVQFPVVDLSFQGLAGPLVAAFCYYLAAVSVFPRNLEEWESLDQYFEQRKRFVVGLLLVAELVVDVVLAWLNRVDDFTRYPHYFWVWIVPYHLIIFGGFAFLFFARGKRANIAALVLMIAVFVIPYWTRDDLQRALGIERPDNRTPGAAEAPAAP